MTAKNLNIFTIDEESKKFNHWQLFIDGAARNNPGAAGAGVYLTKNDVSVLKKGFYLGIKTNNQAEYGALLLGLYFFNQHKQAQDHLDIFSDSELLVKQFKGEYRVKHPELLPLHMVAKKMLNGVHYTIAHVVREKNTIADELANHGIDTKQVPPSSFITLLQQNEIHW